MMDTATATPEFDTRKESHSDMNDWLTALVRKRIAQGVCESVLASAIVSGAERA